MQGSGDTVIDNPMSSYLLHATYPIQITWRLMKANSQLREHYEIGAFGRLVHRFLDQYGLGFMPIRQFDTMDDLRFMFQALLTGTIKLEDAPTYKIGEETARGEPVETVAQIHAGAFRRRNGRGRRRL